MYKNLYMKARAMMAALKRDERGVSALEYVILVAVVVGAVAAASGPLKQVFIDAFGGVTTTVNDAITASKQ